MLRLFLIYEMQMDFAAANFSCAERQNHKSVTGVGGAAQALLTC